MDDYDYENDSIPIGLNYTFDFSQSVLSSASLIGLTVASLTLNIGMLLIFILTKKLRTAFSVYIIVLLLSNILYAAFDHPLEIMREQYGHWWMGFHACNLFLYNTYIICAVSMHTHVLITINRIWALVFPVSYKQHHNVRNAWRICFWMIVYVHVFLVPGYLVDLLLYRQVDDEGCVFGLDAQFEWAIISQFVVYDLPIIFIVGSYPFLLRKQLRRGKVGSLKMAAPVVPQTDLAIHRTDTLKSKRRKRDRSKPFVLLTLLTIGIFICWTPTMVFYTMSCFMDVNHLGAVDQVSNFMYGLQSVLDPIFFALSLQSVFHHFKLRCRIGARMAKDAAS